MTIPTLKTSYFRDLLPNRLQVPVKFWYNRYFGHVEEEVTILALLARPGCRAIDIGGNRGVYSYGLWRAGAIVEVFEPNTVCAEILTAWACGKPRIQVHRVALSDSNAFAELRIPISPGGAEHDTSASLEGCESGRFRSQIVETKTLDSFNFDILEFVKIDVEGHELSVLLGGAETIRTQRPTLLVEIEQRHRSGPIEEVFSLLTDWGYIGAYLHRGKLHSLKSFSIERDQRMDSPNSKYIYNFLFFHTDRIRDGRYATLLKSINQDCGLLA